MKPASIILSILSICLGLTLAHADGGSRGGLIPAADSAIVGESVDGTLMLRVNNGLYKQRVSNTRHSQFLTHSQRFDNRQYDNRYNRSRSVFRDHDRDQYRNEHKRSFRNDYRRDYPRFRYNNKSNCRNIITIQRGYYGTRHVISTICDSTPRHKFQKTNPFKSRDHFRR